MEIVDLISVIIPVYNVQRYINRCIKSVLGQTYRNLEIILVDDGSIDKSASICRRFQKKDGRIKVINIKNQGVSVARNLGLESATGEYVCFLDSDDFLPSRSIEYLYNVLIKDGSDLSLGCWTKITPKGTYFSKHKNALIKKGQTDELIDALNLPEMKGPVAKLFKNSIIKNNQLHFPKNVLVSEDTLFVYQYTKFCKSISLIEQNVYFYNKLSVNSATTKFYDKFNSVSFECVKLFVENVVTNNEILFNYKLQEKIVSDFIAVLNYLAHFKKSDRALLNEKIKETYQLFEPYIKEETHDENVKAFSEYAKVKPYLQNGEFDKIDFGAGESENSNRATRVFKVALLKMWTKIKTLYIFKFNIGYKN